jgi:uncharacterized protein YigE (DUF2233 family)
MTTRSLRNLFLLLFSLGSLLGAVKLVLGEHLSENRFVSYIIDPRQQQIQFYWRDERNERFGSIQRLKLWLAQRHTTLLFAMNGGMYAPGGAPQGLFIQHQHLVAPLDTATGVGNFYLKPNGVFYLTTANMPVICPTTKFHLAKNVAYATQSGPLLLLGGQPHPAFTKGSANLAIRNGVGILPNHKVVFVISREQVNFYDFATYFQKLGCREALYLDGYVSRMYLPAKNWQQTDGDFGVILGVTTPATHR